MGDRLRSYRVAGISQEKGGTPTTYKITIPPAMGRLVPGVEFVPEWHEDGILLRRVEAVVVPPQPEWLARITVAGNPGTTTTTVTAKETT